MSGGISRISTVNQISFAVNDDYGVPVTASRPRIICRIPCIHGQSQFFAHIVHCAGIGPAVSAAIQHQACIAGMILTVIKVVGKPSGDCLNLFIIGHFRSNIFFEECIHFLFCVILRIIFEYEFIINGTISILYRDQGLSKHVFPLALYVISVFVYIGYILHFRSNKTGFADFRSITGNNRIYRIFAGCLDLIRCLHGIRHGDHTAVSIIHRIQIYFCALYICFFFGSACCRNIICEYIFLLLLVFSVTKNFFRCRSLLCILCSFCFSDDRRRFFQN